MSGRGKSLFVEGIGIPKSRILQGVKERPVISNPTAGPQFWHDPAKAPMVPEHIWQSNDRDVSYWHPSLAFTPGQLSAMDLHGIPIVIEHSNNMPVGEVESAWYDAKDGNLKVLMKLDDSLPFGKQTAEEIRKGNFTGLSMQCHHKRDQAGRWVGTTFEHFAICIQPYYNGCTGMSVKASRKVNGGGLRIVECEAGEYTNGMLDPCKKNTWCGVMTTQTGRPTLTMSANTPVPTPAPAAAPAATPAPVAPLAAVVPPQPTETTPTDTATAPTTAQLARERDAANARVVEMAAMLSEQEAAFKQHQEAMKRLQEERTAIVAEKIKSMHPDYYKAAMEDDPELFNQFMQVTDDPTTTKLGHFVTVTASNMLKNAVQERDAAIKAKEEAIAQKVALEAKLDRSEVHARDLSTMYTSSLPVSASRKKRTVATTPAASVPCLDEDMRVKTSTSLFSLFTCPSKRERPTPTGAPAQEEPAPHPTEAPLKRPNTGVSQSASLGGIPHSSAAPPADAASSPPPAESSVASRISAIMDEVYFNSK